MKDMIIFLEIKFYVIFVFNEMPSGSFINTIHESCLGQMDESMSRSCINNDDMNYDDNYNHEELIHGAIEDLNNDDPSHTNEVIKNALNELNSQEPIKYSFKFSIPTINKRFIIIIIL